ncbi:phytoene desaturase family protein, partial [Chloroflexota bacterium]
EIVQKMLRTWMHAVMMDWLNPPPPWPQRDRMEELYDHPTDPIDIRYQYLTPVEITRELIEDTRFQAFCVRVLGALALWPDRPVSPIMFLMMVGGAYLGLLGVGYWEGGTHQVIHALQRVLAEQGGKTYVNQEVDKVLVENGKAKGIKLVDGTEIEARKLVITNVDPRQLTFRLLRDVPISDFIKRKVNNIVYDVATLFWGNIAYHERPQYIAEEFCPGVGHAQAVFMGDGDVDYFFNEYRYQNQHIRPGHWPNKMYFWESANSLYDPRLAPPGKHTSLIEEYGPPANALSEREWHQLRREVGPRMLEEWRKYAPNMTDDNIIGWEIDTPGDFAYRDNSCYEGSWQMGVSPQVSQWGRFRPIAEYAQYKVPGVQNLYCTGIGWHSNFGSPAGFAYNMYKQAAWDLGLREFWKEKGRDW